MRASFSAIYGVDFSGAKLAGRNIWVARVERRRRARGGGGLGSRGVHGTAQPYELADLACLEKLCGTAERAAALAHLVDLIAASDRALWAMDFPFGFPLEVIDEADRRHWPRQLDFLRDWGEDAYALGLECLRRA